MSKSNENLYQKMLNVYEKLSVVVKNATIDITATRSYTAVTHDAVTNALRPFLVEQRIIMRPTQKSCVITQIEKDDQYKPGIKKIEYRADVTALVEFINVDNPSEIFISEATAYALDSGDKSVGKAYSMAIKMILLKSFMLESKDEEEARPTEAGSKYTENKQQKIDTNKAIENSKKESQTNLKDHMLEKGYQKGKSLSSLTEADCENYLSFFKTDSKERALVDKWYNHLKSKQNS